MLRLYNRHAASFSNKLKVSFLLWNFLGAFRRMGVVGFSLICLLWNGAFLFAQTQTFNYTGSAQTFTVPGGVTQLTVDARGAGGGSSGTMLGGQGGRVVATINVVPGTTYTVIVGGAGQPRTYNRSASGGGGFSGLTLAGNHICTAGGGGGAAGDGGTSLVGVGGHGGSTAGGTGPCGNGGAGGVGGPSGGIGGTGIVNGTNGTNTAGGNGGNGGTNRAAGGGGGGWGPTGGIGGLQSTTSGQGGNGGFGGGGGGGGGGWGSTNDRNSAGGGGGGGWAGGGGGSVGLGCGTSGGGGGGGGSNYIIGGSTITTNTAGGGASAATNGQVILTWTTTPCAGTPNGGTATINGSNNLTICSGGSFTLSNGGSTIGNGITYQWQSGPSNVGPWTNISGGTSLSYNTSVTSSTYFRMLVTCTNSGISTPSNLVNVTISAITPPTANGTTVACGAPATLTASGSTGSYLWYTTSTGGTSVGMGPSYTTPSLLTTTTYYVEAIAGTLNGTQTFNYTGGAQTFVVPSGVTQITFDARGASGGNITNYGNPGLGGRTQATLTVTPGQTLNIYVGGTTTTITGGYNGGGNAVNSTYTRGGGGATDVRIGGVALTNRVLVAAGGGGSGYNCTNNNHGGNGGGLTGASGWQCGTQTNFVGIGGSQVGGGAFGNNQGQGCGTNGTLGVGGTGACTYGGGGGGGYYGGGGGGYGGGGGGSSYVTTTGSSAITHTSGYNTGNGQITLTWVGTSCASARTPVVVTVSGLPAPPTVSSSPTINCGATASLTASGSTGNYRWFATSTGGTALATTATFVTPPLTTTTTYYVEAFAGCVSLRTPVVVTVSGLPAPPTVSSSPTINCGATASLTASGSTGNYQWFTSNTGGTPIATGANYVTQSLTATTTYYVEAFSGSSPGNQTYNYSGSIQNFTVPAGVTSITIDARGAQGGMSNNNNAGGLGARMQGTFAVTPGQVLQILVGEQGQSGTQGGGGGGSFVVAAGNTPLIIAGGGGGAHYTTNNFNAANANASITTNGQNGIQANISANAGLGGVGGNGGNTGTTYTADGAGGGGMFTNGQNGSPAIGGSAFVNGGAFGAGGGTGGRGGFGGGGGGDWSSWTGGGGGGGYSGGGGGAYYGCGGGGGSYNVGTSPVNTAAFQSGNGQILISWSGVVCSSTRTPVVVNVNTPAAPTTSNVVRCTPGTAVLTAGGSTGSYAWYTVPTGGTPVSTNASYTTPSLSVTTTYYVEATSGQTNVNYTFTTAGATADVGPTQTQINNAYSSTNLNGLVTSTNGIQSLTISQTGTYRLTALGARGAGVNGGLGASIAGDFTLNAGDILQILVGQRGTLNDNGSAGGGGSYVVRSGVALVIAGGGGGNNGTSHADCNGQAGTSGMSGWGTSQTSAGGTGGNAGISTQRGQGGAGWNQDGPVFSQATTDTPARRFLNGGRGGFHNSSPGGRGGFGGGGGTWNTGFRGSGGGGGYSGGGTGYVSSNSTTHRGGGAGSLNTGTNQVNQTGVNTGDGQVILTSATPSCPSVRVPVVVTIGGGLVPSVVINANPNTTICQGTPVTFTATPTNGGTNPTFQWRVNGGNVATGTSFVSSTLNNNDQVSVVMSTFDPCIIPSTAASNTITISVNNLITNNSATANQTVCANLTPAPFTGSNPVGGSGVFNYMWESSPDGSTWSSIPGATSQNHSANTVTVNTYFRRIVTSGACTPSTSSSVTITPLPIVVPSVIISANPGTSVCTGTNVTFTATPTNGGTTPAYQWSINGGPVGSNSSTYTTNSLTNGNIVQVTLTSNANCASPTSVVSNSLTIQVNPIPTTPTIISNSPLCQGSTLAISTTPTAFASYAWTGPAGYTSSSLINSIPNVGSNRSGVYSLVVTVSGCPSPMATATVLITDSVGSQSISSAQTLCSGSTPSILTGANPTGGTGIYTYTWDSSSDNTNWSALPGETNQTISPPTLTTTVYYRRMVGSGICPGNSSNSLMITVEQPLGNNSLTSAQTICSGDVPASLTGSNPTGGNGAYTYVWGSSTNNITWSAIPGANQIDYSPGSMVSTIYYRRIISGGVCPASTSQDIQIWVDPLLTNNTVQSDQTICAGNSPASFTGSLPVGGNGVYNYQWESSTDNSSWNFVSGAIGQNYTEGVLNSDTYYRRIVVSGPCTSISASIAVRVEQSIQGNTIIHSQTICANTFPMEISGSTPSGGNGLFVYIWESSSNTLIWSVIPGASSQNYQPGFPPITAYYRRIVQGGVCLGSPSNVVSLIVEPIITNNTVLGSQTLCATQTSQQLTGSLPLGGSGAYTYLWESSNDNSSWGVITGYTNQSLVGQVMTSSTYYRRIVMGGACVPSSSVSASVMVMPQLTGNTVSGDQTICFGNVAMMLTGGTPGGGAGSYSYQWEESTNNITFTSLGGANGQNYTPGMLGATRYFRRVLSSGPCTDISNTVLVIVDSPIGNNTVTSAQTICVGATPSLLGGSNPSGGDGNYLYQWESSSNNVSWGSLSGETQVDHQPGSLSSTIWYRRVVGAGVCTPSTSSSLRVLVNAVPTASLSGAHTICMGSSAQLTALLTGVGPWDLAWSDGMSTQTIVGINSNPHVFSVTPGSSSTYTLGNIFATCNGTVSGTATVQVNPMPTATISGANTICTGGNTALSVSFTGTGPWNLGYNDGVTPVMVNGITNNPYVISVTPSSTRVYSLSSVFATCSGLVSGSVTVVVNPMPTAMLTGNQTICTGSNANLTLLLSGGAPWDVVLSDGTNTIPFNGINSSPFTAVTAPLVNTTYTVQSVFATCAGNTTGSSSVVVNPVPTASISGGQTICNNYGTTLTFNFTGVGPWSINYTDGVSPFNINGISNPTHVITVSPSVSRTYTLTSVFATCNGSVSGSANIGVTNPPFAFMTGNRTICQGDNSTVQIGLSGFGPWNITYSTGSGNVTVTGITSSPYQFNITPSSTSYFSMVNVNSNCPGTAAGNATIVVNPIPSASFVSSYLPVCTGQGRQVQVNLTGVQPWSITYTDGFTPITLTGITSSPYTFSVNPVGPETYTLTNVNATCNGTFGNASVLVQPEAAPTATLSGTQTVCMLTPATLSVNFTGTGPWDIVYTDGANNFGVNGLTANPSTFTVNMGATQKTINLVSVTGACVGLVSGTAVIDITNKPVAVMSAPSGMCLGIGGQLSVNISGLGPWDLTYTDGTNFYTENAIASSPYSWTVNPTENSTYQLTNVVSPHCTGSVLSTPISVPVSIQPTASLSGTQTICSGNVANLTLSLTGQAPWTAVYSNGTNSFVLSGLTTDTVISLVPMSTTTYTLTTVATNGCTGVSTGSEEVTVIPNVSPSVAGTDQTICSNAFILNGNIPGVGTGEWKVLQGTGTLNDSSLYNASVGNLSVGTNVLVWEITSGICVSTSQITLEVMVPPTVANAGTDQYLCGTSTVMNGNTPVNGTGTWTVLSGMGTLVDPNDANSPVNNLLLGHTVLQWTIVGGGCTSSSIVNVYAALSAPATSAGQDQLICNSVTNLNAMTPTVGTGIWVRASGSGTIQDTLDAQSAVNGLSLGLNSFVWITQNAGCYATDTVEIQVVQAPVADFIYTQFGFDVDFADVSQGGAGSYSWTFGDGSVSMDQNPHYTYMQAGVYPVRLIITNVCRSDTAYDTIRIGGVKNNDFAESNIGIELYPNPASSGYVEMRVKGIYGESVKVRIYNMLGSEVLTREIATEGRESFTQRIELGTLLSKGTYTVILETEKGIKSEKLVVL